MGQIDITYFVIIDQGNQSWRDKKGKILQHATTSMDENGTIGDFKQILIESFKKIGIQISHLKIGHYHGDELFDYGYVVGNLLGRKQAILVKILPPSLSINRRYTRSTDFKPRLS